MSNNDNDLFNDDDFDFGEDDFGDDDLFADASSGAGLDDDFDINEDDLFGGDDFGDTGADDFGFEDEFDADDFDLGEDAVDFGADEDLPEEFEDQGEGASPGFIPAVIGLGVLFLALLAGGIAAFFLIPTGPTELQLTATAITIANLTVEAQSTQQVLDANETGTAVALAMSVTPTPSPTATNTRLPTFTPEPAFTDTPELDPTEIELTNIAAQATANFEGTQSAEQTQAAITPTITPQAEIDIEGTRAALVETFAAITETFAARTPMDEDLGETPTPDGGAATGDATAVPSGGLINQGELPDAGLFDDFAAGSSLGFIALAAFGLVGLIMFSRMMRSTREDDE
jgi:hypothetical protein